MQALSYGRPPPWPRESFSIRNARRRRFIEFLEYVTPRDGRPAPADARANDLAYGQTSLVVADAVALERRLRTSACDLASPGVVAPPRLALGFARAFRARDPDGHGFQVVEG